MLRPYQEQAVANTIAALDAKPLLVMPTGSGKTFTAAEIVKRLGLRTLWVAHRRELIDQAAGTLDRLGLFTGIILAGREPTPEAAVQVASVQTLARREIPEVDLVVIDEAHHVTTEGQYAALMMMGASVIGLTATPFRLDGKGLGDAGFGDIIVGATPRELCADGTLVEPEVYAAEAPDMRAVRVVGGDYRIDDIEAMADTAVLVGNVVETWIKRAFGRRTVVFAISRKHSLHLRDRFVASGVRAEHVDGSTPGDERDAILKRLASGATTVLCNVGILTEGWDLPSLEVAVIARPTASLALHLQCLGRIMRKADGKGGATVLDHAGNYHRHGLVTDSLTYSLQSKVKRGGERPGPGKEAGIETMPCPSCGLVVPAREPRCPSCRTKMPVEVREDAGELARVGSVIAATFEERAAYYRKMYLVGVRNRERNPEKAAPPENLATAAYKTRYGNFPNAVNGALINPSTATPEIWAAFEDLLTRRGIGKGMSEWSARRWAQGKARDARRGA